jgi:two-component system, LuxR family, response regulator FixJ
MRDNFELLVLNLEPVHLYQGTVEFRRCAPLQCATQRQMPPKTNSSVTPLVFVVDDDASVAGSTARFIRSQGMRAEAFLSGEDLLNSGRAAEASCLILDLRMPNMDGLELQQRLKEIRSAIPVIFFSAQASREEEEQALRSGAVAFLRKPVSRDDLLRAIHMAVERTG